MRSLFHSKPEWAIADRIDLPTATKFLVKFTRWERRHSKNAAIYSLDNSAIISFKRM
jgi:hypothetical protein